MNWALDPRKPRYSAPGTRSDVQSVTPMAAAGKAAAADPASPSEEED